MEIKKIFNYISDENNAKIYSSDNEDEKSKVKNILSNIDKVNKNIKYLINFFQK